MRFWRRPITWVTLVIGAIGVGPGGVSSGAPEGSGSQVAANASPPERSLAAAGTEVLGIPLDQLPATCRDNIRRVLDRPTLVSHGPVEIFHGRPELYLWLLDHPDQGVRMWRGLGARCMDITDQGGGRFGWKDGQGTVIHWDTVYRDARRRIWLAECSSRPVIFLPAVTVRAVVILRHGDHMDSLGSPILHHQADLYVQTDSRAAALVARLLGPQAPLLAEQCVSQLELFFSALVWYADRHPDRATKLLGRQVQD
jgi:hypothetical protein